MKINVKKIVLIVIILMIIIVPLLHFRSEKKWYRFDWSLNESRAMLEKYHKTMYFLGYNMDFYGPDYHAHAKMSLDDKYETYTLHSISFEWDNKNIVYEINKTINFTYDDWRYKVYSSEEFKKLWNVNIPEIETWYEMDYLDGFPVLNFSKIFKGKRIGDRFPCKITIIFSIDNDEPVILSYTSRIFVDKYTLFGRWALTIFP